VRDPTPAFEVDKFEYVDAAPGLALVRLAGRWRAQPDGDVGLVAWLAGEKVPLAALPAPPAEGGTWRAAYSSTVELMHDPAAEFELEPPNGPPIRLPSPVEHGVADEVEDEAEVELEAEVEPVAADVLPAAPEEDHARKQGSRRFGRRRSDRDATRAERSDLRAALTAEREARQAAERLAAEERARAQQAEAMLEEELRRTVGKTEELIDRIGAYEHNRISFEQELDAVRRTHADLLGEARHEHAQEVRSLREDLDAAQSELTAALHDLAAANDHVDTLHEAHSLELGAARNQRDAADARRAAVEEELAEERAAAAPLRARLEEREELIERARAEAAQASAESAELQAAVESLRDAIAARVRDDAALARRRFARTPEGLDRSREELRRDAERITALERQAEALRDAIHSQLSHSMHASPLQEVLPLAEAGAEGEAEGGDADDDEDEERPDEDREPHGSEVGAPPAG
jgi:hypothetical protein